MYEVFDRGTKGFNSDSKQVLWSVLGFNLYRGEWCPLPSKLLEKKVRKWEREKLLASGVLRRSSAYTIGNDRREGECYLYWTDLCDQMPIIVDTRELIA